MVDYLGEELGRSFRDLGEGDYDFIEKGIKKFKDWRKGGGKKTNC
jgi:hypothetical protein